MTFSKSDRDRVVGPPAKPGQQLGANPLGEDEAARFAQQGLPELRGRVVFKGAGIAEDGPQSRSAASPSTRSPHSVGARGPDLQLETMNEARISSQGVSPWPRRDFKRAGREGSLLQLTSCPVVTVHIWNRAAPRVPVPRRHRSREYVRPQIALHGAALPTPCLRDALTSPPAAPASA